jgi:putative restriction endonuclease
VTVPVGSSQELLLREMIAQELAKRAEVRGGFLKWSELTDVALPDGTTRRLVDPGRGGIWNPSGLDATLSIVTSPDGPYADQELAGGLLSYHYQAGPEGGKNLKLRRAMDLGFPLIRFHKVANNAYVPIYPVYVIDDDPDSRVFTLSVDPSFSRSQAAAISEIERQYVERLVRQRVHQPAFRARVMLAYDTRCAICNLKHARLLDAAHIIGDALDDGAAVIANGLSLCKIHHAAYDENFLGISPDYEIRVNSDLLEEIDGPMLRHGLQEMHRRTLLIPAKIEDRPDPARLDQRFSEFLAS